MVIFAFEVDLFPELGVCQSINLDWHSKGRCAMMQ